MNNTIGFFGDSFCSERFNMHSISHRYTSYISKLSDHYNAKVVNLGHGGSGVWDTLLNQLTPFIQTNTVPDICVFVWTIPGRLFHRTVRRLNQADTLHPKIHTYNPLKYKVWNAAKEFYGHLYDWEKEELEHKATLRYIDQCVLPTLPSTTKIIHLWTAGTTTEWSSEGSRPSNVTYPYSWSTGVEIRPSLLGLSLFDNDISILQVDRRVNHLDGNFKNELVFQWIRDAITNYETSRLYDYSSVVETLYNKFQEDNPLAI